MQATGFANRLERADGILIREVRNPLALGLFGAEHDVVRRQDALKSPVTVGDREPPHLLLPHGLERLLDVIFLSTSINSPGDHLAHYDLRSKSAPRSHRDTNVAIGNHAEYL